MYSYVLSLLGFLIYIYIYLFIGMGQRRLRFYSIKNEDQIKKRKLSLVVSIRRYPIHVYGRTVSSVDCVESVPDPEKSELSPLPVSLPIAYPLRYFYALEANSSSQLGRRLQKLSTLPPSWVMASQSPVVLCKMQVQARMKPTVLMSVEVQKSKSLRKELVKE